MPSHCPRRFLRLCLIAGLLLSWLALPRLASAQQPMIGGAAHAVGREMPTSPQLALRPTYNLRPGEHPILPAVRWAYAGVKHAESIQDYACIFVKRVQINGELTPHHYIRLKVRHRPFSVYVYFETPEADRGQEAIYVEGRNDGKLLVHGVGLKSVFGTVALDPNSPRAMANSRHPVTHIGFLNLVKELIRVGEHDAQFGESEVKFIPGAKIDGRSCTCMQFVHPVPRREFRYHLARMFIDDELHVPIRFEAYDWPKQPGGEPPLLEEYTYLKLKLNMGLTDADFDVRNPEYGYR